MFHIYGLSKDHRFPQQFSTSPCPPLSWSSCPKTQTPPMAVSTWRGFLSNEESIGLKSCQFWSYFLRLSPQIDWLYFILADSHLYPKKKESDRLRLSLTLCKSDGNLEYLQPVDLFKHLEALLVVSITVPREG